MTRCELNICKTSDARQRSATWTGGRRIEKTEKVIRSDKGSEGKGVRRKVR